jgi:glycosyltransferase involved in cell wall biosynthesis
MVFFGRLSPDTLPIELIKSVGKLPFDISDLKMPLVALAGPASKNMVFPPNSLYLGPIAYSEMPGLNRACNVILGQDCPDSDFLGSGKILDAIASGTPVICRKNAVRIEQLGSKYEGHYETIEEGEWLIKSAYDNHDFLSTIQRHCIERSFQFSAKNNGDFIRKQFEKIGILNPS